MVLIKGMILLTNTTPASLRSAFPSSAEEGSFCAKPFGLETTSNLILLWQTCPDPLAEDVDDFSSHTLPLRHKLA